MALFPRSFRSSILSPCPSRQNDFSPIPFAFFLLSRELVQNVQRVRSPFLRIDFQRATIFFFFSFLFPPPRRNFFRIFENYGRFLFYFKRKLRGIFVKLRSKDFFVSNVNSRLSGNYNDRCFFSSSTMRFPWNFSQLQSQDLVFSFTT